MKFDKRSAIAIFFILCIPLPALAQGRGFTIELVNEPFDITYSSDDKLIAIAHSDGIAVVDAATGMPAYSLDSDPMCRTIAFSENDDYLYVIHDDNKALRVLAGLGVWHFRDSNTIAKEVDVPRKDLTFYRFIASPHGNRYVHTSHSPDNDKHVFSIFEISKMGELTEVLTQQRPGLGSLMFIDDGATAVSVRDGSYVDYYDTHYWSVFKSIKLKGGIGRMLDAAGNSICVAGTSSDEDNDEDATEVYWKPGPKADGEFVAQPIPDSGRHDNATGILLHSSGEQFLIQSNRIVKDRFVTSLLPILESRDIDSGKLKWEIQVSTAGGPVPMHLSGDGMTLVYVNKESLVLLNIEDGKIIKDIPWHDGK